MQNIDQSFLIFLFLILPSVFSFISEFAPPITPASPKNSFAFKDSAKVSSTALLGRSACAAYRSRPPRLPRSRLASDPFSELIYFLFQEFFEIFPGQDGHFELACFVDFRAGIFSC